MEQLPTKGPFLGDVDSVRTTRVLSYYAILGVTPDSTTSDIRMAYKKLAMKWHPDRWVKDRKMEGKAKKRFQRVQQAYEVLSDPKKRALYDMGLYDGNETEQELEDMSRFIGELVGLMAKSKKEEKGHNMDELQAMLQAMYV